jgi:transcriptional regulator with XRE-family HTH domain
MVLLSVIRICHSSGYNGGKAKGGGEVEGIDKLGVRELLSERRKALGLSLEQMAEKIEMTYSALWRAENDPGIFPLPDTAVKICRGYGVSLAEYLLAAGYDFGEDGGGEDIRKAALKNAPLAEYLAVHYSIMAARMVADMLEPSIRHQASKERAAYAHPTDGSADQD